MDEASLFAGGVALVLGILLLLYGYPDFAYYNSYGRVEREHSQIAWMKYCDAQRFVYAGAIIAVCGFVVCLYGVARKEKAEKEAAKPEIARTGAMTAARFCSYCGARNESDNVYCWKCGKQFESG